MGANRLAAASGAWGTNSFSYDGVGNRLSDVTAALNHQSTYAATSNRLTSMTENAAAFRSYTYDGAGNTLTEKRPGENFQYGYNNRNRLTWVTRNGANYATYGYYAFELMTSRVTSSPAVPTGTVHYIYDTSGHLIAEANAATRTTTREYIWLPSNDNGPVDLPIAIAEAGAIYHVHADHLGRPIRMTNGAKTTVWAATWKPWGEIQSITGSLTNNLRYPGQYFQIETNLHYNWHRHYDPATGRYTQPDPLGFVDGPSIYAYAGSSPYMHTDRDGRYLRVIARFLIRKIMNAMRLCQKRPRLCSSATMAGLMRVLNRINKRGPGLASGGGGDGTAVGGNGGGGGFGNGGGNAGGGNNGGGGAGPKRPRRPGGHGQPPSKGPTRVTLSGSNGIVDSSGSTESGQPPYSPRSTNTDGTQLGKIVPMSCQSAFWECLATTGGPLMNCRLAYDNCKMGLITIFPGGIIGGN